MDYIINSPCRNNICAVIVTYNPDEKIRERLRGISEQVGKVIIVDNASSERCTSALARACSDIQIDMISNKENFGIATALNQGVNYAIECGYSWAITLDQDTVPDADLIANLILIYNDYPLKDKLGVIGASYEETSTGTGPFRVHPNVHTGWLEIYEVITSGSLMCLEVFQKVGPFRDDFFMYYVDHEYCARLRSAGFKVIITLKSLMKHNTGNLEFRKLLWRKVAVLNYAPPRHYYIIRNGIFLIREFFFRNPKWALIRLSTICKRTVTTLIFEKQRLLKLFYIMLGVYHGLLGRSGKLRIQKAME